MALTLPDTSVWLAEDIGRRRKLMAAEEFKEFFEHVRTEDPDLAGLRGREEFEALFTE